MSQKRAPPAPEQIVAVASLVVGAGQGGSTHMLAYVRRPSYLYALHAAHLRSRALFSARCILVSALCAPHSVLRPPARPSPLAPPPFCEGSRVSVVDYRGQVLYDQFVQPTIAVTDYRTAQTGIVARDLAAGMFPVPRRRL